MKNLSSDTLLLIKKVVDNFDKEDSEARQNQLRTWKRLKLMWEGIHNVWYSSTAHDWKVYDEFTSDETNQSAYDKPVNIFRAYLESIIAALSVVVPPVQCYPDDAENSLDVQTAKAGDKIGKLIFRHNDASLLWIHALFIFCTEGMVASRVRTDTNKKYGEVEVKEYEDVEEQHQIVQCPTCGFNLLDEIVPVLEGKIEQEADKFDPTEEDVPVQDYINEQGAMEFCPSCAQQIIPQIINETLIVTRLVNSKKEAKSRVLLDAFGGINVKVANYARNQSQTPYLILKEDIHYSFAVDEFGDVEIDGEKLHDKIKAQCTPSDPVDAEWYRLSLQYNGSYPRDLVCKSSAWIRKEAFNILPEDECDKLCKLFPNGMKATLIGQQVVAACNEDLDDHWTLTYNPLADHVHFDPLGLLLVSVQELINDIISLTTQTIEQGIGQTFADPEVLSFDAYRQLEANPGGIYEAKPRSGKSLNESFHELKTATLSSEVLPFFQQLQNLGQMVSGALPSLFGGSMQGGSQTASEYSMSRAQALQRLQNSWKMLTSWWKNTFAKAIPAYIKEVKEDERNVERQADGSFVNIFIRRAELEGRIGRVELEANENLPITWNQRKDVIMQLMNAGIPEVLQILGAPENLPLIREAIGLDDFFVPGEDTVEATYDDIRQLLQAEPMQMPDEMGGVQEMPSIEIDPEFIDLDISFEIVRKWIVSDTGRTTKTTNPPGYRNVLLYGKQLKGFQQQQQQMMALMQGGAPQEKPAENTETPITGEQNVPTDA